jgi:peroxiredoxin
VSTAELTIAEQVETLNAGMAAQVPAEIMGAYATELGGLAAGGLPDGIPTPGTPMPDGDLLDVHGEGTTFEQARGGKPAVVVFYRGAWCPYCNLTLNTYQQQLVPALEEQGVELIAINPQKPGGSLTMQKTHSLTYTVLSDPGNGLAGKLGILTAPIEDVRIATVAMGLDIPAGNADGTDTMPMPTVLTVDAGGTIRWVDVHPNYATRSEPKDILAAVAAMSD